MKKIIIIGAGAMGSAFTVPCIENKNDVALIGTHLEEDLINNIKSKNNFHPALKLELPAKLKVEKYERLKTILEEGVDIIDIGACSTRPGAREENIASSVLQGGVEVDIHHSKQKS